MTTDTSWRSLEDAFHSSLIHFFDTLRILAATPEEQCEAGKYFNVAWELNDDLSSFGEYICKSPASILSQAQKDAVLGLVAEVKNIPSKLLVTDTTIEGNIAAMRHPIWDSVRIQAAMVSQILEPLKNSQDG